MLDILLQVGEEQV